MNLAQHFHWAAGVEHTIQMKEKQLASLVLLDIFVQKTQLTLTLSLVQRAIFAQMELSMQLNTLVPRATIMVPHIVSAW